MKRIIILSLLLYYISCKTICSDLDLDAKKDDCLNSEAEDTSKDQCCYIEVSTGLPIFSQLNLCYTFPRGVTEKNMKHIISEVVKTYALDENTISLKNYKCNKASYLKVGLLLLSLFLF